jgi:hypothetical protein
MNRTELEAQIKAARDLAESLERLRDAMPVETEAVKEWPIKGDHFWSIDVSGAILCSAWGWPTDCDERASIGNVLRTKAQAERHVEALKVAAELRRMPWRRGAPNPKGRAAWAIICDQDVGFYADYFGTNKTHTYAIAGVWFESRAAARHAIDTIGQDRLRLWLSDYLDEPMGDE